MAPRRGVEAPTEPLPSWEPCGPGLHLSPLCQGGSGNTSMKEAMQTMTECRHTGRRGTRRL